MNIEQLFLRTLDDLESRAASNDEYVILGTSALLRKLLLDEAPLMDQVNRKHRLKIEFEIVDVDKIRQELQDAALLGEGPEDFFSVQDSLDPTIMPNAPPKSVKRDAFLATGVQMLGDETITVRDVIRHQAHIEGGVHAGAPRDSREEAFHRLDQEVSIGGHPPILRQLKSISAVVLKALEPLKEAVQSSR